MKINKEIIEKLNPCKDRFDNFVKEYPDFNSDLRDFLSLDNISYSDKIWVVTRLFTKEQNVKFAVQCGLSVLDIFESKHPNDNRPRKALEAVEKWLLEPTEKNRKTAYAVAYAASYSAAYSAAYSAVAHSAVDTASYAAYSAAYAAYSAVAYSDSASYSTADATASAAASAASTAAYAYVANTREFQEELNLIFLMEAL